MNFSKAISLISVATAIVYYLRLFITVKLDTGCDASETILPHKVLDQTSAKMRYSRLIAV